MLINKKGTTIILIFILTICVLAFMGFRGLVTSIRNQRTCEWANIDNIESHAHIDVPKVTKWDCDYGKASNTKRASFTIDKNNFDDNRYIQAYGLQKLSSSAGLEYSRFLNLQKDSLSGSELYYKQNLQNGERYEVLFDKTTGKLWVTIKFKD